MLGHTIAASLQEWPWLYVRVLIGLCSMLRFGRRASLTYGHLRLMLVLPLYSSYV